MYAVLGDRVNRYNVQPRFMLYRWHVPDPICFDQSIRVVIQNMHFTSHGHRPRRDDYASTAYWYQTEPHAAYSPIAEWKERLPVSAEALRWDNKIVKG